MTERDQSPVGASPGTTAPVWSAEPVAVRGPDSLGGLLLILAGLAAALSLVLDWVDDLDGTGLDLVRDGFDDLDSLVDTGLWQPMAVVLGGGVLLVLGVLMWLPARSHRLLGLLGLLVSGLVVWAVVVPLQDADWRLGTFGPGFWCAIAVAVLGVLGSLKALLTGRRYY
ncbi:hypothetical protein JKP75_15865 [Blastococcus sp. TML/M2B]|uniref:hypothetical protein n=1 Tax=unclassified Blastococcus TaxID=2619396 RepID=UPI00190E2AC4|nr:MULTISPECIES: hypothetical protein [unclassified Blastococcus]MBN1093899.1 hypothetical protein [Blastococcus sp. TML/M2B]MBN1095983.1 hypothetical protein [Blastococcus sp. TML/C7B]